MLQVVGITFPIFAMVALGYFLVARGIFKPEVIASFGFFVMNVALPALIFNAVSQRSVGEVLNGGYVAAYALGAVATMVVAFIWFSFTTGPLRRAIAVMGVSSPNSLFIGYPLMLIVFPDIAGLVLAMSLMVESFVITPITFLLIVTAATSRAGHPVARARATILNILRRPVFLALVLGLSLSALGISPPEPVMRLTTMVADASVAIALLVIGGSVAGLPMRGNRALAAQIVAGKLLVQPLLTFLVVLGLGAIGIHLAPEMGTAVVLTAALPMFSIYAVFAQEFGEAAVASLAQLGATTGAFFTLSILLALLT